MSKIFKDDQDLVSIANAFQNVIKEINKLEYFYKTERALLKENLNRDIINGNAEIKSEMQEQFEEYTYSLKTIIRIKRIIEDKLFLYDLELEDMEE